MLLQFPHFSPQTCLCVYNHCQIKNPISCLCFLMEKMIHLGFPCGSEGKASACNAEDLGSIPGSGLSPGEENGNHSGILSWKIPWKEVRLQSMGSQRVGSDWATSLSFFLSFDMFGMLYKIPWRRTWQPSPLFLPGESPWTGEPHGLRSRVL